MPRRQSPADLSIVSRISPTNKRSQAARPSAHVRFWLCPEGWMLPGGYAVDWLAAGTYDKMSGLSLFTLQ